MARMVLRIASLAVLALAWNAVRFTSSFAQAPPPSERMQTMSFESPIEPEFKYARNMAILDRFEVSTFNNQFEYFTYNANHYLIVKEFHDAQHPIPDTSCFRFYNVSDPSQPVRLGRIDLPDSIGAGDIETFQYGDTTRLIFYGVRFKTNNAGNDLYLDVLVGPLLMENRILQGSMIDPSNYQAAGISTHNLYTVNKYNEMIYGHEHHLLLATNRDVLRIIDLSTKTMFDSLPDIMMYPTPSCTQHTEVKNHEVKACTRSNGEILVGVGVLRSGMKILTFDPTWNLTETVEQNYDHDRTLFPETIINPTKVMWDSTIYQPLADDRNNKWDHRVCHSVLPYDDGSGGEWVLTVDEFTSSNSGQYENEQWIPALWEGLDFYATNRYDTTSEQSYPIWYNGQQVRLEDGSQISYSGWDRLLESDTLRLNYAHRNHPKYPGVDPLRLQGAFLRIWDRDSLGTNDTTANNKRMLVNAYDVQENDSHPEGYVGLDNIPEVSDVPTGLHEPYLVGNTLYLAGYNTAARASSKLQATASRCVPTAGPRTTSATTRRAIISTCGRISSCTPRDSIAMYLIRTGRELLTEAIPTMGCGSSDTSIAIRPSSIHSSTSPSKIRSGSARSNRGSRCISASARVALSLPTRQSSN